MPRLSANLGFLWPDRPLLERIDAAAAAGFRAVELHWPFEVPAERVRARCAAHGLRLLGVNTPPGDRAAGEYGLGAVAGREAAFTEAVDLSLAWCRAAGGTAVHCMAGVVAPADREAARALFVRNLRAAAAKAGDAGLVLLVEPMNHFDVPGYALATAEEGAGIVDAVARPNVRLMLDCYHVGRSSGDVMDVLTRLLPTVGHVQVAGVPGRGEPDTGDLDYRAVFAALDRLGYEGWVGAEYRPTGSTDAGLAWTAALGVPLSPAQA